MSRSAVETHLQPGRQFSGTPEKDILTRMQELHVPNASVTVIKGGVVEWSQDYDGVSQASEDSAVAPVFQAGSISKTVNAVLAMKLLVEAKDDAKKIKIDEDLSPRLLAMGIPNNTGKAITLAQLLSHTAGTSVHGFPGYLSTSAHIPSTSEILAGNPKLKKLKRKDPDPKDLETPNTIPVEVVREPGKECVYSGGGTTIIQKLIEDAYPGETYASLAQTHIFNPLGMTQSSFEFKAPGATTGAEVQKGHDRNGSVIPGDWRMHPELGAAGLWTTSKDLAKFTIAMQDAYLGNPNPLLSTETARHMLTRQPDLGYELCLASDDPNTALEPNKLYIALDEKNQTLMYSVLTSQGVEIRNKPLIDYVGQIPDPLTAGTVTSLDKTEILKITSKAGDTRDFRYGLGFEVHGEGDAIAFCHGGVNEGFQADFICFPNLGMGAIVMTNSDNGMRLMREIFSSLAQNYDYPERTTRFVDAVTLDDETLQRCGGEFKVNMDNQDIFFFAKIENGQLHLSLPMPDIFGDARKELVFTPLSPTKFFCVEHQFEVIFDTDYTSMVFADGLRSIRNDMPLSDQQALVDQIYQAAKNNYIFSDKLSETVFKAMLLSEIETINRETPHIGKKQFCEKINAFLKEIDPHLIMQYDPSQISDHLTHSRVIDDSRNNSGVRFNLTGIEPPESAFEKFQRENYGFSNQPIDETAVPANIGYLKITDFLDPTADSLGVKAKEKAHELLRNMQGKQALVIDLRGSHGGSPEMVEFILSYLLTEQDKAKIPNGVYNTIYDASKGQTKEYKVRPTEFCLDMPIRVLTDEHTFSAAEEMAYDLQQINRHTLQDDRIQVVGQKTKGGAHPMTGFPLTSPGSDATQDISQRVNPDYFLWVPDRTAVNPYTGTNWEDGPKKAGQEPGVKPDVEIPIDQNTLTATLTELTLRMCESRDAESVAVLAKGAGFISQHTTIQRAAQSTVVEKNPSKDTLEKR